MPIWHKQTPAACTTPSTLRMAMGLVLDQPRRSHLRQRRHLRHQGSRAVRGSGVGKEALQGLTSAFAACRLRPAEQLDELLVAAAFGVQRRRAWRHRGLHQRVTDRRDREAEDQGEHQHHDIWPLNARWPCRCDRRPSSGGSAACGCALLLLRWMVAGVGDTTTHAESGTPSER